MTATIYPRINPTVAADIRTGAALAPLRIQQRVGDPGATNTVILASDKDTAALAAVAVMPGVSPPAAPGQVLPFRVQYGDQPVHIKVSFFGDPAAATPFSLPADLRVAVIPNQAFSGQPSVSLRGSIIEGNRDMLPVSSPFLSKNVPAGSSPTYAQLQGGGIVNNVLSLTVSFIVPPDQVPAGAINANWFLVVRSALGDVWLTFAVTETPGDAATVAELPWIHVPSPDIDLGGPFTPGVLSPASSIANIRNFGTGPLIISGSVVPEGADQVHLIAPASAIAPGGSGSVSLQYLAGDGISALHVPLSTNDAAASTAPGAAIGFHEAHIEATATAASIGVADTILVLDASGSMALRPDGAGNGNPASSDPAGKRRWDNLQRAVDHMAFGYVSFLTDASMGGSTSPTSRLGVAVFPDVLNKGTAGWERRAGVLVDAAPVTTAGLVTTISSRLVAAGAALEGRGLTPIGEGLEVAMGNALGEGMFHPDRAAHRRWLVLMTDGAHNAGDTNPREFIQPDAMPDFVDKEVRVFSIAYATETTGAAVDLLQDLAENALNPVGGPGTGESRFAPAPPTIGFEKGLTDVFLDALATTIGLEPDFDPVGVVTANNPIAIHEFRVSPFDAGVGLFIDWESQDLERLQIALISPRCERFDEAELARNPAFQFRKLPDYAHAYISQQALAGSDTGSPRFGTWKLELRLRNAVVIDVVGKARAAAVSSESYKFSIYNRSNLKLEARATSPRHAAGEPIELVAHLRAAGIPVRGARVVGTVTAPALDFGTLLANVTVKSTEPGFASAAGAAPGGASEVEGTWAAKAHALAQQLGPVQNSRTESEIVFEETQPGVYRAKVRHTPNAGVYSIHVVATGLAGEVGYRRERVVTATLEAVPDAAHTLVTYSLAEHRQILVHVRPRDVNDRVVIFDPIHAARLGIEICNAKPTGDVTNAFDGSYSRGFALPTKGRTELVLSWDGVEFLGPLPVPDIGALDWVDAVHSYKPGPLGDDAPHNDPKKALGPVKGPADPFVSLGGGRIALGVNQDRRCSRVGHFHPSHIAVFTDAARLQPYRVLVRRSQKDNWIEIGTGVGPVQIFQVPPKLGVLQAVLIDDLGGDRQGGARLQGVGYVAWRPSKPKSPPRAAPSATKLGAERRLS